MSLFSRLLEYTYADMVKKQADITDLFPTFHDRVRRVAKSDGILLTNRLPEVWHFKVASAAAEEYWARRKNKDTPPRGKKTIAKLQAAEDKKYDVYIRFKNIYELLKKHVSNKAIWVKSGNRVDMRKLADAVFNDVDIETSCSCPASLYWGPDYIRSTPKIDAQHGDKEERPPVVRNPSEHGSLCKHGDLVFDLLKVYKGTFAKHLSEFWKKTIDLEVEMAKKGGEPPAEGEPEAPKGPEEPEPPQITPGKGKAGMPAKKPTSTSPPKGEVKVEKPAVAPGGTRPATTPTGSGAGPATQGHGPATSKKGSATSGHGSATGKA